MTFDHFTPPIAVTGPEYAAAARRRRGWAIVWTAVLSLVLTGSYTVGHVDNILIPVFILVILATPFLLWRYPTIVLYVTLGAACLIEAVPLNFTDGLTDKIPFFWNVNSIFQQYAHVNFKAIPLSMFEVFVIVGMTCSTLRSVFTGTTKLYNGPSGLAIYCYIIFVIFGWVNGMLTGGDFKLSLQEVRAQFYLVIAYLVALNVVEDKKHLRTIFWITAISISIKGILFVFRRYVTLAGLPLNDQGVGSHEEAFFFNVFAVLLVVLILCRTLPRLKYYMMILMPVVLLANLACNRRAATAAMVVVVPVILMAAYRSLPDRRRLIVIFSVVMGITSFVYFQMFKNSTSTIGQPARAIQSQFSPDARDASSNAYRDAENADLMATIKLSPLVGYGFGKHMLHAVPIADISEQYEWWDVLTHNQILWVWMRVGTFGFIAFWLMVCTILISACQLIRHPDSDAEIKTMGLMALLCVSMLMIFGLLDLQLANFRDMLFTGVMAGAMDACWRLTASRSSEARDSTQLTQTARGI